MSGNYPLVKVLQEALARDMVERKKLLGKSANKKEALRRTAAFIQIIHKYRDSYVNNKDKPPERVAIFDEAQRAWTLQQMKSFMKTKKGILNFEFSEPEFLISTMDRHKDWAVIVCLVGGGQEINIGEAGLPEWFDSLRKSYTDWNIYVAPELRDEEYLRGRIWEDIISGLTVYERENLHLSTSVRSFRTPDLAALVKAILDNDLDRAQNLYLRVKDKYPIKLSRDLTKAKSWLREQGRGTTRYGLLASSGGIRLKPEGIYVKNNIDVEKWFLNDKYDIRSSYALEDVATEFDVQGLELDYSLVAWDADFRYANSEWNYYNFRGTRWNNVNAVDRKTYLKNAYRVLLTRARQGMVIFVPKGSNSDDTRKPQYYDGTYDFLKMVGIEELS